MYFYIRIKTSPDKYISLNVASSAFNLQYILITASFTGRCTLWTSPKGIPTCFAFIAALYHFSCQESGMSFALLSRQEAACLHVSTVKPLWSIDTRHHKASCPPTLRHTPHRSRSTLSQEKRQKLLEPLTAGCSCNFTTINVQPKWQKTSFSNDWSICHSVGGVVHCVCIYVKGLTLTVISKMPIKWEDFYCRNCICN